MLQVCWVDLGEVEFEFEDDVEEAGETGKEMNWELVGEDEDEDDADKDRDEGCVGACLGFLGLWVGSFSARVGLGR